MKFIIVVSCVLAISSASLVAPVYQKSNIGFQATTHDSGENLAGHNFQYTQGTSFQQNSKSYAATSSKNTQNGNGYENFAWAAPLSTHVAQAESVRHWSGPQNGLVVGHKGASVDTQENNALHSFHHAAQTEDVTRSGDHGTGYHTTQDNFVQSSPKTYGARTETLRSGPQHSSGIGHYGVPVNTQENNNRHTFHYSSHTESASNNGNHASGQGYTAHTSPVIYGAHEEVVQKLTEPQRSVTYGHYAVPVNTHGNNDRRTFNNAAHSKAIAFNGNDNRAREYANHASPVASNKQAHFHTSISQNNDQGYAAYKTQTFHGDNTESAYQWAGNQHLADNGHNGVSVNTNENNVNHAFHYDVPTETSSLNGAHTVAHSGAQGQTTHQTVYPAQDASAHQWTRPQHLSAVGYNAVSDNTNENNAQRSLHQAHNGNHAAGQDESTRHTVYDTSAKLNNQEASYSYQNRW